METAKARQESEESNVRLMKEKAELAARLESERGEMGDEIAKQQKLQAQKADLESQLNVSDPADVPHTTRPIQPDEFCIRRQ